MARGNGVNSGVNEVNDEDHTRSQGGRWAMLLAVSRPTVPSLPARSGGIVLSMPSQGRLKEQLPLRQPQGQPLRKPHGQLIGQLPAGHSNHNHADPFSSGVYLAVRMAQCFSLFPMRLRPGRNSWRFRWWSLRTAYSCLVTAILMVRVVFVLIDHPEGYDAIEVFGALSADLFAIAISLLYLRLARRWCAFTLIFVQTTRISTLQDSLALGRRLRRITVAMLCIALAEHCYDRASLVFSEAETRHFASVLALLHENLVKRPFSEAFVTTILFSVETVMAFFYVFNDVFIILVSVALRQQIRNFNSFLRKSLRNDNDHRFWEETRCFFLGLARLTKDVNEFMNPHIFMTYTQNLFFICYQLLYFLRNLNEGSLRRTFRIFSFAYVLARTFAVSYAAASINDEGKVTKTLLFSVPSRSYCTELRRFFYLATSEEMALTGLHFFRVTRSFIMTVAGTIATYEIILLQIHNSR